MSWKYASIAHALTLKNVGVLQQTLYLVATAMGLAPCALGGYSDTFATAAGTDYYAKLPSANSSSAHGRSNGMQLLRTDAAASVGAVSDGCAVP